MDKVHDDNILEIPIPAIGFLGLTQPTTIPINKAYLKLFVRLIVVYCTFLIFKPRMAKSWNIMFGDKDEGRRKEINERIAKLESERGGVTPGPGKKNYAVATRSSGTPVASPVGESTGTEKGGSKRRKA